MVQSREGSINAMHTLIFSKTIQIRHTGRYWKSKDGIIGDVFFWTRSHGRAGVGRPARTYLQQLCMEEDQPNAMNDRDDWRERVRHDMMMIIT